MLLRNCTIGRNNTPLISGLSLDDAPGEILQIEGPNGIGKTTVLETILGELTPLEGERGPQLPSPRTRAHQRFFGYMPSQVHPLPSLNIQQWLAAIATGFGVEYQGIAALWRRLGGRATPKSRLEQLSSGNLRKALAVNAFAIQRQVLLLDEPFEELDSVGRQVLGELIEEQAACGAVVVVVSHTPLPKVHRRIVLSEDMAQAG